MFRHSSNNHSNGYCWYKRLYLLCRSICISCSAVLHTFIHPVFATETLNHKTCFSIQIAASWNCAILAGKVGLDVWNLWDCTLEFFYLRNLIYLKFISFQRAAVLWWLIQVVILKLYMLSRVPKLLLIPCLYANQHWFKIFGNALWTLKRKYLLLVGLL